MKKSIPSRLCDRCGNVYRIADTSKARGRAFEAKLNWTPPEGTDEKPIDLKVRFGDLCPNCAKLTAQLLTDLDPKPPAPVEGGEK